MKTTGFAAQTADAPLAPFNFERRDPRADDVVIDILYCGVCHSDLHMSRNDWAAAGWPSVFPCVPGHEIVGRVRAVGRDVSRYRPGDAVAVGCMVDSCRECDQCKHREEQFCRHGMTLTYGGQDRISGETTFGGYSTQIVVREEFVMAVPDGLDLSRAAPLLCAGITTYSPLRTWNVGPGSRVGVIGLGGLGHMAVKFALALGADVTVVTRSEAKREDARALGCEHVLISSAPEAMAKAAFSFDLIIDTIPTQHDLQPYVDLLDVDGTLVIVGALATMPAYSSVPLLLGRRRIAGSPIGGIAETEQMLAFAAEKQILPECELIEMQQINQAFVRMERGDVRYRFVIDMASLR
jgi:uncharacterized zinc-type alcohol dehydrogenase-like protein